MKIFLSSFALNVHRLPTIISPLWTVLRPKMTKLGSWSTMTCLSVMKKKFCLTFKSNSGVLTVILLWKSKICTKVSISGEWLNENSVWNSTRPTLIFSSEQMRSWPQTLASRCYTGSRRSAMVLGSSAKLTTSQLLTSTWPLLWRPFNSMSFSFWESQPSQWRARWRRFNWRPTVGLVSGPSQLALRSRWPRWSAVLWLCSSSIWTRLRCTSGFSTSAWSGTVSAWMARKITYLVRSTNSNSWIHQQSGKVRFWDVRTLSHASTKLNQTGGGRLCKLLTWLLLIWSMRGSRSGG